MSQRSDQVSSVIQKELGALIARAVEFPAGTLATVSRVETSPDLKLARVFIVAIPKEQTEQSVAAIIRKSSLLSRELSSRLTMKFVPRIVFAPDSGELHAAHMDELLDSIQRDDTATE